MYDGSEAMIVNSSVVIRYNSAMDGLSVNYADTPVNAYSNSTSSITTNNAVPTQIS